MKPAVTTCPLTSTSAAPDGSAPDGSATDGSAPDGRPAATAATRPSATATSRTPSSPVSGSMTRPPRSTSSQSVTTPPGHECARDGRLLAWPGRPGRRQMTSGGTLRADRGAGTVQGVVLVAHGGQASSTAPTSALQPAVLRMIPVAAAIRSALRGTSAVIQRPRFTVRGWNGPHASPVADLTRTLDDIA